MTEDIKKLSNDLYKEVLEQYYNQKSYNRLAFGVLLDNKLQQFNKDAMELIIININTMLKKDFGIADTSKFIIEDLILSDMLHKNSRAIKNITLDRINYHLKNNSTVDQIRKAIFDGYNYNEKDILELSKTIPKYLLKKDKIQAMKLKTKPLKIAYLNLIEAENTKSFNKAMNEVLNEKTRYYANRIAVTERSRAFNNANNTDILNTNNVEFVKFTTSSKHPLVDICDYYKNLDVGYGKGIIPKEQMLKLPLHPHCKCVYTRILYGSKKLKQNKKIIKDPAKNTLNKFTDYEKAKILGSKDKLLEFENGKKIEDIFNQNRPNYKIELFKR